MVAVYCYHEGLVSLGFVQSETGKGLENVGGLEG